MIAAEEVRTSPLEPVGMPLCARAKDEPKPRLILSPTCLFDYLFSSNFCQISFYFFDVFIFGGRPACTACRVPGGLLWDPRWGWVTTPQQLNWPRGLWFPPRCCVAALPQMHHHRWWPRCLDKASPNAASSSPPRGGPCQLSPLLPCPGCQPPIAQSRIGERF